MKYFTADWLHAVDLGVGQDVLGNLFFDVLPFLGATRDEQVQALWQKIRKYYQDNKTTSRLETLTLPMIKGSNKPPKLRSKAAISRHLLPFAVLLAEEFADKNEHMQRVACLVRFLAEVFGCLGQSPYPAEAAGAACRKFCALYTQLENEAVRRGDAYRWKIKPKLHLFQELVEYIAPDLGSPDLWWTYYDESWGGHLARIGERRGGAKSAVNVALNVLQRFIATFT